MLFKDRLALEKLTLAKKDRAKKLLQNEVSDVIVALSFLNGTKRGFTNDWIALDKEEYEMQYSYAIEKLQSLKKSIERSEIDVDSIDGVRDDLYFNWVFRK